MLFELGNSHDTTSIATIFFPLAVLGLLRPPAALWLIETESYQESDEAELTCSSNYGLTPTRSLSAKVFGSTSSPTSLSEGMATEHQPKCSRSGILVRGFWFLSILILFKGAMASVLSPVYHVSGLATGLFYIQNLALTICIFAFYVLRGRTNTTVLPCIDHVWYKVYAVTFWASMVTILTLCALETRKTPCGALTIYSPSWDSLSGVCGNSTYVLPLNSSKRKEVGSLGGPTVNSLNASSYEISDSSNSASRFAPPLGAIWKLPNGTYEVVAFEGWCQLGIWESTKYSNLMDGDFSG